MERENVKVSDLAVLVIFAHAAAAVLLGWLYFRRWRIQRPPIGVLNLWEIGLMLAGIVLIPYLYLALPGWLLAGLLGLGLLSIVYFTLEPVIRSRPLIWLAALAVVGLDAGAALRFGGQSAAFFAVNNLAQLLAVVGVSNLWAQSGLKARDAAILGAALTIYDFLFTSVLGVMSDLFNRLSGMSFAPMVAWPAGEVLPWLAIGLGDLLLAAVYPLAMRKAFGRSAGLAAMAVALCALAAVMSLPLWSGLEEIFPVMVALGPLMVVQYGYWRRRCGTERTTWQYLEAEPFSPL